MNNIPYFKDIVILGDLYLDTIFSIYESEPIVFLCKDRNNNIYFCICTEIRYIKKWLIAKISSDDLSDLENHKVDIYNTIIKNETVIEIVQSREKEFSRIRYTKNIDKYDLPEKGAFLKINTEDI